MINILHQINVGGVTNGRRRRSKKHHGSAHSGRCDAPHWLGIPHELPVQTKTFHPDFALVTQLGRTQRAP
jgi:hypothetical protein